MSDEETEATVETGTTPVGAGEPVLVTGGAGYIGSHACLALARAGFQPVAFDDLSTGNADAVRWGPLVIGDIGAPESLREVFARHQPIAVLHFAAKAYVGESVVDPRRYYRTNVAGSLRLLEAVLDHGSPPIVFSSSCATYGVPNHVPIREDTAQQPINPYGATKLTVERALADFGEAYGLRSVVLRYFNAAGADPRAVIGERHDPETHLIPRVLEAATGDGTIIEVFGDSHPTPDGTCIRDYIHVVDLADAHVRALHWLLAGQGSLTVNLGTGTGASVREVIAVAAEVVGTPVDHRIAPARAGDPPSLVASAELAKERLGWQPRRSDLRTIITDAWRWHQLR
ncbi:MAG: UDP-glucose 4-epimerase GalE [Nitriliruptoraceae bacterium]